MEEKNIQVIMELEQKRKKFIKHFIVSISLMYLFYTIVYFVLDNKIVFGVQLFSFVSALTLYYVFTKLEFDFKTLTYLALYFGAIGQYIQILIFWKEFPIIYTWLFLFPIGVLIVDSYKSAIGWMLAIILLSLSAPFVSTSVLELIGLRLEYNLSTKSILIINVSVIIWATFIFFLILYYYIEFNNLKNGNSIVYNSFVNDVSNEKVDVMQGISDEKNTDNESKEKFDELYKRIINYFEKEAAYMDSEFNINKLALDLNTNQSYISKALNRNKGSNFKNLLNNYRITEVKKRLKENEHEKYTLKHIYTSVGFTQQTTFNRAFKDVEGITPSEYIENLK